MITNHNNPLYSDFNYDSFADEYDKLRLENKQTRVDFCHYMLDKTLVEPEIKIFCDIGCGTGNYINDIISLRPQSILFGLDPSNLMLEIAASKTTSADWIVGVCEDLPFKNKNIDVAFMTFVVHHLNDIDKSFFEIYRILRPGGHFFIRTMSEKDIRNSALHTFIPELAEINIKRYPSLQFLKHSLINNGLAINEVTPLVYTDQITSKELIARVRAKYTSALRMLPKQQFYTGLRNIEKALEYESVVHLKHFNTIIHTKKPIN